MRYMAENYSVSIEIFAQRHYIKNFEKKYPRAWDIMYGSAAIREIIK